MKAKSGVAVLQAQQRKAYQLFKIILESEAIDRNKLPSAYADDIFNFGNEIMSKKVGRPKKPNAETLAAMAEVEAMIAEKRNQKDEQESEPTP